MMDLVRGFVTHRLTVRLCQLAIGVIMVAAGLPKIGDLAGFAQNIHNYRMIPIASENLLAMTLPWVEVTTALALFLGVYRRAASLTASAMMVVFTVAVAQAVLRNLDIECGCFGTGDATRVGVAKLLENLGMLAIAVVASLRPR